MNARFITVDVTQFEDALKDAEIALTKLRKIVDRYDRAADAARRAFDGNASADKAEPSAHAGVP